MIHRFRPIQIAIFWTVILCVGLVGCQQKVGEPLFPVTGRIMLDGQPLPRGSLTLRIEATGQSWHQPTGMIDDEGRFIVYTNGREGAPPGAYRVIVFVTEAATTEKGAARPGLPRSLIPARYNDPEQTPLHVRVVAQPSLNAYNLELNSRDK